VPNSVATGGQVPFNSLGTFKLNGKEKFKDLTTAPLTFWFSSNPDSLFPPAPGANGGIYTTGQVGCACIQASNSGVASQFAIVGVYTGAGGCPACTAAAELEPNASMVRPDAAQAQGAAQSAGIVMWSFDAGSELRGRIATGGDGSIYFITRDGVLHGLDSSGKEIMNRQAEGAAPVVLADGTVVAMSSASKLAGIDTDGTTKWQLEIGAEPGPIAATDSTIYASAGSDLLSVSGTGLINWRVGVGSVASAATTADGVVVASSGGAVTSLASDGAVLWKFTPAGGFSGSIASQDDVVYAGSLSGALYAIDLRTGNPIWSIRTAKAVIAGPAVSPSGTIFFGSDSVYAVQSGGQLGWTQSKVKPDRGGMSAINYDEVFDAATDGLGVMLGSEGSYVWTSRSFGTIATSAVSASGTLYVANTDGRVFAIR
jgi:outer membrane protein assembly factor BamB